MNARATIGAAACLLAAAASLSAHHSLSAEYNPDAAVTLVGRITKVEWQNPHSFIEIECTTPDGKTEHWRVEAAGPSALTESGISREMLAVSTAVTINGLRAKNGSMRAWGQDVTFPDGAKRKLTDSMLKAVADADLAPPSFLAQLTSTWPLLPYVVGAAPLIVLLAGLLIMRRRRFNKRSVPQ